MKHNILIISILIIIFSFQFHQNATCQINFIPGFIITKSGDTLTGFIDYRAWENNPVVISFRKSELILPVDYRPNALMGFGVNNEVFVSAVVNAEISPMQTNELDFRTQIRTRTDTAFLKVMFKGVKSLFYYRDRTGKQHFYIGQYPDFKLLIYKRYLKEGEHEKVVAENKTFLGQLNLYLQDCPKIKTKISSTVYTKKSLENLFKAYYEFTKGTINYQFVNEKTRFDLGVLAGVSMTKLKLFGGLETFNTFEEFNFPISWNLPIGLSLNIVLPGKNGRWSIYNELLFTSYKVNQHAELYINEDKYTLSDAKIGYSYIKLNDMLRYNFKGKKDISMFLNFGISSGYAINETNTVVKKTKDYGEEVTELEPAVYYTQRYEQGFLAGIGANIKKISIEMRLEKGSGMTTDSRVSSTTRTYFLLGFKF